MAQKPIVRQSILGGMAPTWNAAKEDQFLSSIAIDPERQINSSLLKPGNIINPIGSAVFSGANVTGAPMWIETTPKNQNVYTYLSDGKFISYSSTLASETVVGTPTAGAGNGMKYYNNYYYLATPTDISRYGPLDNSPSLTNTVWTGSTLGSQTALTNTTYPGTRNITYPNHPMHVHTNNTLYVGDFKNGQGLIHAIVTTKVTNEGDTNNGSAYNVLDLPFGYAPFDIESYGTDLAILACQLGSSTTVKQGNAAIFLWDTFSSSFYRQIPLPDTLGTALLNQNGELYAWTGAVDFRVRLSKYNGGYGMVPIYAFMEGSPPSAGAVDGSGNRIVWGQFMTYPYAAACVFAYGYENGSIPPAVNNIMRISNTTGTFPIISALKYIQQAQRVGKPVVGWRTDTTAAYGLDATSDTPTVFASYYKDQPLNIGQPFVLDKIVINLAAAIGSGTTITPRIFVDNETTTADVSTHPGLTTINLTNFPNGERSIVLYPAVHGTHNFYLELAFTGTLISPIDLPIIYYYTLKQN